MKLKIYYRSPVVWNMVLFVFFSFIFIYFQHLSMTSATVVEKKVFETFVSEKIFLVGFYLLSILLFFTHYKLVTSVFFRMTVFITLVLTAINLSEDFSKLSLIILFFYSLFSFYLYQFFSVDIKESYYNPQYSSNSLFEPMLKKIKIEIWQAESLVATGFLTNWSQEGCFAYLYESAALKGKLSLKVFFLDHIFEQNFLIATMSKDKSNYGLKFKAAKKEKKLNLLGWKQFYEIIEEMGYKPELLK